MFDEQTTILFYEETFPWQESKKYVKDFVSYLT